MRAAFLLPAFASALALSLLVAGCAAPPAGADGSPGPAQPGASVPPRPNYTKLADGTVQAVGHVGRSDLEGGFWALYDIGPTGSSSGAQPKILAVLLPGKVAEPAIAALEGSLVTLTGRARSGVSVRMAGPEVAVDTIAAIRSGTPQ